MKLEILTIVLDGFPFLQMQLATFNRLECDWTWNIVHGAAANTGSTSWCKPQEARLSTDGSSEFLNSLRLHPRVRLYQSQWWPGGKDQMCNAPLDSIKEPCVLLEIDVDELWTAKQIDKIVWCLDDGAPPHSNHAMLFKCRYFVGPNIVTVGMDCYGNNPGEWARAWLFEPGQRFLRHEPPILSGDRPGVIPRDVTAAAELVFDHWAYVFPHQVAYKEQFYGYPNALAHWRRLQHNTKWPCRLKDFLPWVDDRAKADLLFK